MQLFAGPKVATVFVLAHLLEEALNKTLFDAFVATELHFESQSLFGKYFKRVTGISPRQYRSGIIASNTSD